MPSPRVFPLPFVLIANGAISGITTPGEEVARTEAAWDALWRSWALRGMRPDVRFDDTMAVAVFLGSRPTAGYEAEVVGVRQDGDTLVVQWREHGPPSPGNPPVPTKPFVLAGVPQHPDSGDPRAFDTPPRTDPAGHGVVALRADSRRRASRWTRGENHSAAPPFRRSAAGSGLIATSYGPPRRRRLS